MYLRTEPNRHGTGTSIHKCNTCGEEFSVTPAVSEESQGFVNCLSPDCASYDPERDLDILFMSDCAIKKQKVVSMDLLRKRKEIKVLKYRQTSPPG